MTIIVFIIILGILVLIHELGHFIAAKKQGIMVEEFGFGYPPRLFGIKKGETLFSINLIPLGGFVKLYGEEYEESNKKKLFNKKRAFSHKKPWQKILVIVAGAVGNFILGWILISFLFIKGIPAPTDKVLIDQVQKNSPAAQAGIKEKDVVIKISNNTQSYSVKSTADFIGLTKKFAGNKITLTIIRNSQEKKVTVVPRKNPPSGQGPLGITITNFVVKKYPWYQAPFYGLIEAFNITRMIIVELVKTILLLLSFKKPAVDITGPIGIARFTGQAIKFGSSAIMELVALLSLNLAVVNLLPFPALDGGHLVLNLYEWVTRRRVNKTFEKYLNFVGLLLLLTLAVLISVNDIIKIYR